MWYKIRGQVNVLYHHTPIQDLVEKSIDIQTDLSYIPRVRKQCIIKYQNN
jgi:hypothetical protein